MPACPCVFIYREKAVILSIYVDDGLAWSKSEDDLRFVKDVLRKLYEITEFGRPSWFLGLGIKQLPEGIAITQRSYIGSMLEKFGMSDCRSALTPTEMGAYAVLREKGESSSADRAMMATLPYRELFGALLFISTKTRLEIAVAVRLAAMRVADLRKMDWEGAERIFRYLKGSKKLVLLFRRSGSVDLEVFADADFASTEDRKSVSESIFRLKGSAAHDWGHSKQGCVALTTSEAELVAQARASRGVIHERNILKFLRYAQKAATELYQGNTSAIVWSEKSKFSGKAKHLDVKHHFASQEIRIGRITLEYVSTTKMIADTMTKILPGPELKRFRQLVELVMLGDSVKKSKAKKDY